MKPVCAHTHVDTYTTQIHIQWIQSFLIYTLSLFIKEKEITQKFIYLPSESHLQYIHMQKQSKKITHRTVCVAVFTSKSGKIVNELRSKTCKDTAIQDILQTSSKIVKLLKN